jgi:hypothetical protein
VRPLLKHQPLAAFRLSAIRSSSIPPGVGQATRFSLDLVVARCFSVAGLPVIRSARTRKKRKPLPHLLVTKPESCECDRDTQRDLLEHQNRNQGGTKKFQ